MNQDPLQHRSHEAGHGFQSHAYQKRKALCPLALHRKPKRFFAAEALGWSPGTLDKPLEKQERLLQRFAGGSTGEAPATHELLRGRSTLVAFTFS